MKTRIIMPLIVALLTLLLPGQLCAQEDSPKHFSFYGATLDGAPDEFCAMLRTRGFPEGSGYSGTWVLKGKYAEWDDVEAFVMEKNGNVYGITLFLKCGKRWKQAKEQYLTLKSRLKAEYGIPDSKEFFADKYVEGGGHENLAFIKGRAEYSSKYYVDGGMVELKMAYIDYSPMHYELVLVFLDEQNTLKAGFGLSKRKE